MIQAAEHRRRQALAAWIFAGSSVLLCGPAAPDSSGSPEALKAGSAVERPLLAGTSHQFNISLQQGSYLHLFAEQRGIDLVLRATGPDGTVISEADGPFGRSGLEELVLIAETSGEHGIEVAAASRQAPAGSYRLWVEEMRPARPEDRKRVASGRAEAAADRGRISGTEEGLRQAVRDYEQALAGWRELGDRRREAQVLFTAGNTHRLLGQTSEALPLMDRALLLLRELGDRRAEAETLNQIGLVRWARGEGEPALGAYSAALDLWRTLGEASQEARTLNNLGLVHYGSGRPRDALAAYRQALELFRKEGDRRREAIALNNLGGVWDLLGEPLEALGHYRQARDLSATLGDRRNQASALNNLGAVHALLGATQEALDHYEAALPLFREMGDRANQAATLNNLADLYLRLGQPEKARDLLGESLALMRETGSRRGEATVLGTLGRTWAAQSVGDKALEAFQKGLEIQWEVGDRAGEAALLADLGALRTSLGQAGEAIGPLDRSLALRREIGDRQGEARSLFEIGRARAAQGDLGAAVAAFEQALAIRRTLGDRAGEALALRELARAERDRGDLAAAREHLAAALERIETLRTKIAGDDLRLTFSSTVRETYDLAVDVLQRLHQDEAAFEVAERGRARSLLDLLREARVDLRRGVDPALLDRETALRQRLTAKEERRVGLLAGPHTAEQAAEAARELDALLEEMRQVRARIRAASPRYAALTGPPEVRLADLQRHSLDEGTLLLAYSLGEERSYMWAVTRTSVASFELPGRVRIEAAAREAWSRLSVLSPGERDRQAVALAELARMVLTPAAALLPGRRLVVVPDGALQVIPFAALPAPGSAVPILAGHEVVVLPSAAVLAELRGRTGADPRRLALFADPVFAADDPRVGAAKAAGVPTPDGRHSELQRLPWTRREAQAIEAAVPEPDRPGLLMALDFAARRELAESPELRSYGMLHFATHGVLDSRRPELSGLVLSLVDEAGRPRNGFLRLHDIYNLDLRARLVVLSGCRTALGQEIRGEGLVGFTRGFMYAGAPRIVASLWAVQDRATAELMGRFYQAMLRDGLEPAASLRSAQLGMWRDRRFSDPHEWAAFVFQGVW